MSTYLCLNMGAIVPHNCIFIGVRFAKKSRGWRYHGVSKYVGHSARSTQYFLVGGVKQTFFIFHNVWDNPSHGLSYFSIWLKPPTSDIYAILVISWRGRRLRAFLCCLRIPWLINQPVYAIFGFVMFCPGGLFIYLFAAGFGFFWGSWFYAFEFLGFSASLLFCFSAFLLFCFLLSLLFLLLCFSAFCFSCFFAFLLLCFPCFSAFVLLVLSTSTILLFLLFSHVFLLLYVLLLCFFASCLCCLFVFHVLLLYSVLFVS